MISYKQDEFDFECFWNLELIGIKFFIVVDDIIVFLCYYQDIFIILWDKGYNVKLLWKEDYLLLLINIDII